MAKAVANEKSKKSRLEMIAAGEKVDAVIHEELLKSEPAVEVQHFNLWYGKKQALHEISMSIPRGKVTALIGPSGCGKSTLLRSVNRMNDLIDGLSIRGDILLSGESIFAPGVDVIELRKRMGMVFQKPNPFPMSIFENVVYPLRIDGQRDRATLNSVCEQSLRGAALWSEVRERLHESGLGLSGGQHSDSALRGPLPATGGSAARRALFGLDPLATGKIEDLINDLRGHYTVLIVTHNMQQAARGERLHRLHVPRTFDRIRCDFADLSEALSQGN